VTEPALGVLKVFQVMERDELDLHVLFESAGNDTAERQRVIDAVDELTRDRLIEPKGSDFYRLTEKGKSAMRQS
jgi:hypothetical protein